MDSIKNIKNSGIICDALSEAESMIEKPLVVIRCITYNQEKYISQCLDGFVIQRTNFSFVAIVHDDFSTDRTAEIINDYAKQYPKIIKPVLDNYNRHTEGTLEMVMKTLVDVYNPKFIAWCEGDDYWTDPYKLQKQVDYFAAHSNCGMVYAQSRVLIQGEGFLKEIKGKPYNGLESLFMDNYMPTATIMVKKIVEDSYYEEIGFHPEWKMGDWTRNLYRAIKTEIGYIGEPMAVYRVLNESASHFTDYSKSKSFILNIDEIAFFFVNKYGVGDADFRARLTNKTNKLLLMNAAEFGEKAEVRNYSRLVKDLTMDQKIRLFLLSKTYLRFLYNAFKVIKRKININ